MSVRFPSVPAHDGAIRRIGPRTTTRILRCPTRSLRWRTGCSRASRARRLGHVDRLYRTVRRHRQPPVADPCAQPASENTALSPASSCFAVRVPCASGGQRQFHCSSRGRGAGVVARRDRHPRRRLARIDQAQPAGLRRVAGRMKDRDVVSVRIPPRARPPQAPWRSSPLSVPSALRT